MTGLRPLIVKKNFFILSVGWKINTMNCQHLAAKKNGITSDLWINLGGSEMLDCLIIGDSIAVGTKQFRPDCVAFAKGGINSWQWNKMYVEGDKGALPLSNTVIISLGSNDHQGVKTRAELERMRGQVKASRVFWILPAIKPNIQEIVKQVADEHDDIVLPITRLQPDGIHPSWAGYKELAEQTK
jgi:lysophospholipase L1-like esterase